MSNTNVSSSTQKRSKNRGTNISYTNKKLPHIEGRPSTLVREVEAGIFSPYSTCKEKYTCDWHSWKDFCEDPKRFREMRFKQKHTRPRPDGIFKVVTRLPLDFLSRSDCL